ncbi:MAG: hypothetical protein AAGB35_00825 [Pseudomonadota bacterium]
MSQFPLVKRLQAKYFNRNNVITLFHVFKLAISVPLIILLASCGSGGGGGGSSSGTTISAIELIDPTPGVADRFGNSVIALGNGNIVVGDPGDSSMASNSGAVHLYSPTSMTPIASIYGDNADDSISSQGIIALANNNFVIISESDDVGGVTDTGSVILVDGSTGAQINSVSGDDANDLIGSGGVSVLSNGNFVIASENDDVGGISNVGSVRLIDGSTGVEINSIAGDAAGDSLGSDGVTVLGNNNFVIASSSDDVSGVGNGGSVRLVNGDTGAEINSIEGDAAGDNIGSGGVTALGNNNFVIASPNDEVGAVSAAGSVILVDGSTGIEINSIAGDAASDSLGSEGVTTLGNNNFVIASANDDVGAISNAGSVRLVDGGTGVEINTLAGDVANDSLGSDGITALGNNNFVIVSINDDVGGVLNAGSVRLVNGITGVEINALAGDFFIDNLGSGGVTALSNNNFVIASPNDDVSGVSNAGSVILVDGSTGLEINALAGDIASDNLGSGGVTALGNNNFVIASPNDDEGGVSNAGSVRLVNGSTGAEINGLVGDSADDMLTSGGVTALNNNNFVVISDVDDENGVIDAGSVLLVDGVTGLQIGPILAGDDAGNFDDAIIVNPDSGNYYVLTAPNADNNGLVDSGGVVIQLSM